MAIFFTLNTLGYFLIQHFSKPLSGFLSCSPHPNISEVLPLHFTSSTRSILFCWKAGRIFSRSKSKVSQLLLIFDWNYLNLNSEIWVIIQLLLFYRWSYWRRRQKLSRWQTSRRWCLQWIQPIYQHFPCRCSTDSNIRLCKMKLEVEHYTLCCRELIDLFWLLGKMEIVLLFCSSKVRYCCWWSHL